MNTKDQDNINRPADEAPIATIHPPERIYLQTGAEEGDDPNDWTDVCQYEVSWCADRIEESDIEYIRADLHESMKAELSSLRAAVKAANKGAQTNARVNQLLVERVKKLKAEIADELDCICSRTITFNDIDGIHDLIAKLRGESE